MPEKLGTQEEEEEKKEEEKERIIRNKKTYLIIVYKKSGWQVQRFGRKVPVEEAPGWFWASEAQKTSVFTVVCAPRVSKKHENTNYLTIFWPLRD